MIALSLRRTALAFATAASLPAVAHAQPGTVILVRHAERAPEPRADPVLSDAGVQRAHALAATLRHAGVTSIVTTQFQRTQLTARPLADTLGLQLITVPTSGPLAAHIEAVAAAVRARGRDEVVLVVGHSNTIPRIVTALGGPRMADYCEAQYASLVILQLADNTPPRVVLATFGAADPPAAAGCDHGMR